VEVTKPGHGFAHRNWVNWSKNKVLFW